MLRLQGRMGLSVVAQYRMHRGESPVTSSLTIDHILTYVQTLAACIFSFLGSFFCQKPLEDGQSVVVQRALHRGKQPNHPYHHEHANTCADTGCGFEGWVPVVARHRLFRGMHLHPISLFLLFPFIFIFAFPCSRLLSGSSSVPISHTRNHLSSKQQANPPSPHRHAIHAEGWSVLG